jgi:hypothetical protein
MHVELGNQSLVPSPLFVIGRLSRHGFQLCVPALTALHTNQLLTLTHDFLPHPVYLIWSDHLLNEHRRLTAQTLTTLCSVEYQPSLGT